MIDQRHWMVLAAAAIAGQIVWVGVVQAAGDENSRSVYVAQNAPAPTSSRGKTVVYKPPLRGAPVRRVGGASRGTGAVTPTLAVLAPIEIGLTAHEQPTLYWFLSAKVDADIEVVVVHPQKIAPLVQVRVAGPVESGIKAFPLDGHGIELEPGVDYEWSVAIVFDPRQRSLDIISSGVVRYVKTAEAVAKRLDASKGGDEVYVFAEEGLWYDAIDSVSQAIAQRPADARLREIRASLLEQVALAEAALSDRLQ